MKPRRRHVVDVTPYDFWAQPGKPPQYEWLCCCGERGSGFATEDAALEAGFGHEAHFVELPQLAGAAVALLGVSAAGWVAAAIFVAAICLMILALACRSAPTIDDELPEWTIRTPDGRTSTIVKPDPVELWGRLSTDEQPPSEGVELRVPGYAWRFTDGRWERI
jgi:hypothetical protein